MVRLRDERTVAEGPDHPSLSQLARADVADVVRDEARKIVAPVVREAIDDEILSAVRKMVGLAPLAVAAMEEDLLGSDPRLRQNAYSQLLKYTIGHPAIGPKDAEATDRVVINLGLPRPGTPSIEQDTWSDGKAVEIKTCDTCGEEKPSDQFVGMSTRCIMCFANQQDAAAELLEKAGG